MYARLRESRIISALLVIVIVVGMVFRAGFMTYGEGQLKEKIVGFECEGAAFTVDLQPGETLILPETVKVIVSTDKGEDISVPEIQETEPREVETAAPETVETEAPGSEDADGETAAPETEPQVTEKPETEPQEVETEAPKPEFIDAQPSAEEVKAAGYMELDGYYRVIGDGELSDYRKYGSWNGGENAWYAFDQDGNMIGQVREVTADWESGDADLSKKGSYTYTLAAKCVETYDCSEPLPTVIVNVLADQDSKETESTDQDNTEEESDTATPDKLNIGPMAIESGRVGDYRYRFDDVTKTATLLGLANAAKPATLALVGTVNWKSEDYKVTAIEPNAFINNTTVTGSLVIPDTVEHIGAGAFRGCESLDGTLTIPNSVKTIGTSAFRRCFKLTGDLVIPDSVTSIGSSAFEEDAGFNGTLTISKSLTTIETGVFSDCSGLKGDLVIPDSVTSVGQYSFNACTGLDGKLVLPDTVKEIKLGAFYFCANLSGDLVLPSSLIEINDAIFAYCAKLTGVLKIPPHIKKIGESSFSHCAGLTGVVFPDGLEEIEKSAFIECIGLSGEVAIPHSVTILGNRVFADCINIKTITHKKLAGISNELKEFISGPFAGPDLTSYEDQIGALPGGDADAAIHKAVKWTDEAELKTGEVILSYEHKKKAAYDVIFVMDYSASMIDFDADQAVQADGKTYVYPRSFLMEDIVSDAAKILLQGNEKGYDIRVAFSAFGGKTSESKYSGDSVWSSNGFTKDAGQAVSDLKNHPLVRQNNTHYGAGLQDAKTLFDNRTKGDDYRVPVVIFLSDGEPNPPGDNGATEAEALRQAGINVFPMAIYVPDSNKAAQEALKTISYNGTTFYNGENTASFETAMEKILSEFMDKIPNKQVIDVMSELFEVSHALGGDPEIEISPNGGTVKVEGDKITWDLAGCEAEVLHTVKIKTILKEDTSQPTKTTGKLKTNNSLTAALDEVNVDKAGSPELIRYIAQYDFVDTEGQKLPAEVLAEIRKDTNYKAYTGGYRDKKVVTPWTPGKTEIDVGDDTWVFKGWDEPTKTIPADNILFTGTWEKKIKKVPVSFIKVKSDDTNGVLKGAQFKVYSLTCTNSGHDHISDPEDLVNIQNPGPCWTSLKEDDQTTDKVYNSDDAGVVDLGDLINGYYMLVETISPGGYELPTGQWMVEVDASKPDTNDGGYKVTFTAKSKDAMPYAVIRVRSGDNILYKIVNAKPMELPLSGFDGINSYILGGILMMTLSLGAYVYKMNRRKRGQR